MLTKATDLNLREGPSGLRCEWRAAHAPRVSKCKTKSDARTAQGHGVSNVACTLTGLEVAGRPSGGQKSRILRMIKSSMTSSTIVKREQNHA